MAIIEKERFDLVAVRQSLGYSQTDMGAHMGMSLRAYQELEADPAKVRMRHIKLAKFVALEAASARGDLMLLPPSVMAIVHRLTNVMQGKT